MAASFLAFAAARRCSRVCVAAAMEGPASSDSSDDSSSEELSSSEEDWSFLALSCCFFPLKSDMLCCGLFFLVTAYYAPHANWISILVERLEIFAKAFPA